ncbi:MAG: phosphoribosylglycinamide formyltransferase [Bacteroidota bacterium]
MNPSLPIKIAILASGGASNALKLQEYFQENPEIEVGLLLSNNPQSGVFAQGPKFKVPVIYLPPKAYQDGVYLNQLLATHGIDLVVLAGYLKHIPDELVKQYADRILNIHPSLLPRHGGKGMYGMNVHHAVIEAGDAHSGITIHLVNEHYDEGKVIFQKRLAVAPHWSAGQLQQEVLKLEHTYYPEVVANYCQQIANSES